MKFTIPTKDLNSAIGKLSSIPGAHGGSPYTQAVRFEAGMNGLTLTRYTSEARISVTVDSAEIEDDEGTPSVDHGSLSALVSKLPGEKTKLSSDDQKLRFVSGPAKAGLSIFTEDAGEIPTGDLETESVEMPIEELARLFSIASPAAGVDNNRLDLQGVCIRMMNEKLSFIGADGRRCHVAYADYDLPSNCTVSTAGVSAIMRATAGESGACKLAIGENTLSVIGNTAEVSVALVSEGEKYPDITRLINSDESSIISKIVVSKVELIEALKACSVIGELESKMVQFDVKAKKLTISADNRRDSEISVGIDCESTKPVVIGVPSIQLTTALELMIADEEGNVELTHYFGSLFVRQADRIAFVALQRINTNP